MAYNPDSLVRLQALKALSERVHSEIPTQVSQLSNDADYQSGTQVSEAIQTAIAEKRLAWFEEAETIPDAATAKDNILYLVMNDETAHYDIYAKVGGEMRLLDDTTIDLSGYTTTADLTTLLAKKVDVVEGKALSTNDFTNELKAKLDGISIATEAEVTEMLTEVFGATEPPATDPNTDPATEPDTPTE